jgi:hypothetical protein
MVTPLSGTPEIVPLRPPKDKEINLSTVFTFRFLTYELNMALNRFEAVVLDLDIPYFEILETLGKGRK